MNIYLNRMRGYLSWGMCLLLTLVLPVSAAGFEPQSLEEIGQAVREFVIAEQPSNDEIQVEVKSLDKRLRLPRCDLPLNTYWSPGSRSVGRVTVQVECESPKPWRVHVQSTVTLEGFVWVLARGVQRGEILDPEVLVRQKIMLGASNAAYTTSRSPVIDLDPWLGYSFSQRVSAGKVLNERMLKPAKLVQKGEAVLIRIESSGLTLQTKGVALRDAAAGKYVQVRNSTSGKVIDAVVVSKGVVAVLN